MLKLIGKSLVAFALVLSAKSYASLEIVITDGVDSARPVAIVPFKFEGNTLPNQRIADIVSADLMRSGKFNPIAATRIPQQPTNSKEIDYQRWMKQGVEAVVTGTIREVGINRYAVRFELVDVFKGASGGGSSSAIIGGQLTTGLTHILDARETTISGDQFRQYAHRISDIVYEKLTGERGAFLTKIAYVLVRDKADFRYQLVVADYDGENEQVLLRAKEPLMSPAWSPDGTKLAYVTFE